MQYSKSLANLLVLLVTIPLLSNAQQKPGGTSLSDPVLPLDPAVRTGKLANGFTYYIRHNEEPKHRVTMYLVNKVGSILEDEDQRGLAHFTEHMSFNGTKHYPKNELVNYLQKSGIRFGADLNAYTGFDETVYQLPIPSDNPELLRGGLEIMRDWAQEATLDAVEINKERGVVLEEKRLGKGAGERMQQIYWPVMLNNSRYVNRIPIGLDTVLNNFKPSTIKRFYQDWYRPDLQALIIVGDIDVNATETDIRKKFSDLKNPVHERVRVKYTVPLSGDNKFVVATDREMTSTVLDVIIKHPERPLKTAGDYRKEIVKSLFNEMLGGRYGELSRKPDVPFIQAGASVSDFIGGLDSYSASVVAKPGELENGFKALWRETERVSRFGFTSTELERAKKTYLSNMETLLKEKGKTNSDSYVNEYLQLFLKGSASPGITKEYALTKANLPGITLAEVNAISSEYITSMNRVVLITAPEKDKNNLPDEKTVNNWIQTVSNEHLLPYHDNINSGPLLTHGPKPGSVISETHDTKLGITTWTLSNGVKVILKPTTFKNDEIIFKAFAPGGSSLYSDKDYQSAANASAIISSDGVGNYNSDQLDKYLQGKQFSVVPFIGERYQGLSGGTTNGDLENALQMAYAEFTEPRKDSAIFEGIIARAKAGLANRADDPGSVFSDTVSAVLGNYNIRRTGPTLQKISELDLDKAYRIYNERFADASNFTFTFVGSFNPTTLKPLIEKYIASLPATNSHEKARELNIHIPVGKIEKTVYKGSEPKASVLLVFSGPFAYNLENNTCLKALKEALEIRLLQRLREDESGVYSPGVAVDCAKFPKENYSLSVQFGCAPQNVEKLITSTLEEIDKLKTQGPPQENIDKWRAEDKTSMEPQLKTNSFWLNYIGGQLQDEGAFNEISDYPDARNKVSIESVRNMAKKCLSGNNYIRLVLMPQKK